MFSLRQSNSWSANLKFTFSISLRVNSSDWPASYFRICIKWNDWLTYLFRFLYGFGKRSKTSLIFHSAVLLSSSFYADLWVWLNLNVLWLWFMTDCRFYQREEKIAVGESSVTVARFFSWVWPRKKPTPKRSWIIGQWLLVSSWWRLHTWCKSRVSFAPLRYMLLSFLIHFYVRHVAYTNPKYLWGVTWNRE